MKVMILVVAAVALATCVQAAPAVVLVVRHAEKELLPKDDPPLTAAGRERATELARVVEAWTAGGVPLRGVFASEVKRTQETLAPLAASTRIAVSVVAAKDTDGLVKQILAVDGGIVVVAGHSNTLPARLGALGAAGIMIADSEFDRLFAVTQPGPDARWVELRYGR
jgi:phosphohistidine phosphatase SixA